MIELLSLHVPKCAGMALQQALQRHYGASLLLDYRDAPLNPISPLALDPEGFLRRFEIRREAMLRGKRAVHGHFHWPKYEALEGPVRFTAMRDPVERLISHYFYMQTRRWRKPGPLRTYVMNARLSVEEFARMPRFRYFYTHVYFAGAAMERFDYVARCDRLPEGIATLEKLLGIRLALPQANTNPHPRYAEERTRMLQDGALMSRLRDSLRQDIEFYERYAR